MHFLKIFFGQSVVVTLQPASFYGERCQPALKSRERDKDGKQEAAVSLAEAKEISVDVLWIILQFRREVLLISFCLEREMNHFIILSKQESVNAMHCLSELPKHSPHSIVSPLIRASNAFQIIQMGPVSVWQVSKQSG